MSTERRYKHFILPDQVLLTFLRCLNQKPDFDMIWWPMFEGDLPPDARVVGYHHLWDPAALVVRIHSEAFDVVGVGQEIPLVREANVLSLRKVPVKDLGYEEWS